jgi:hypothetical protein
MKCVSETSEVFKQLTTLSAREEFIQDNEWFTRIKEVVSVHQLLIFLTTGLRKSYADHLVHFHLPLAYIWLTSCS